MQLPLPENEVARLENLRSYAILDTPPEQAFDDLTSLAAYICGTPIALIGFIDLHRQWFKSRIGWDVPEVPRDMSFCTHTILQPGVLVVSDTLKNKRFGTSPLATHGGIRFYADAPLISAEGYALGTLCVMDSVPRELTEGQTDALRKLARQVMTQLESRRRLTARPLLKDGPVEMPEGKGVDGILRESDALYRTITETASDAIIVIDEDSKILFVNRATERIFGYLKNELVGQLLTMLMPDYLRQVHQQAIKKYVGTGKRHLSWEGVELPGLHKSGQEIWLQISFGESVRDGKHIFTGICRDISERKRAEEKLRGQETRLLEQMPAVLWTTDMDLRITSSAGAGLAALDWHPDQMVGISLIEFFKTDDPQFLPLAAHLRALQGEPVSYEITGKGRTFEARAEPLRDSEERIVGCISTALDATARKQAEEELRASERRYRSLFEGVVHGLYRVSVDGQFFEVNPALAAMLGYDSPNEVVKLNTANLYADQEERSRLVQKWLETERIEDEVNWNRRNGEIIRVRLSGRTLTDRHGIVQGFEFIAEDVTERRTLEAQLRQAQKIEAVGQLAGGIAHEFNNFLGVILGYSELMFEEASENESLRREIAEIKAATQRAASLTRQLLAFSRKQLLEPKVLNLNQATWEAHHLLRHLVPANIDVVPVLAPTIGQVQVDPGQVQQILINLVANARDAMPEGGKVVIETANADLDEEYARQHLGLRPGRYVMLSVSDTGCGMDAETHAHIFEPFFTTKQLGKGTGLGLSTVHGIVHQSGGYITVESAVGKGTTFRIYLPLVQAIVEEAEVTPQSPTEQRGSETILVVEDATDLRGLLCSSLERRGYKVHTARDGVQAMEILRQEPCAIHLVVSDIMMPHVDGLELKRRAATLRPDVKFLFMSGYSEEAIDQRQTLAQGCAFLEKPFLPDELASKVRELLRGEAVA